MDHVGDYHLTWVSGTKAVVGWYYIWTSASKDVDHLRRKKELVDEQVKQKLEDEEEDEIVAESDGGLVCAGAQCPTVGSPWRKDG